MFYSFIVVLSLVLIITIAIIIYTILVFNSRDTSGNVYFTIDTINKRILRHSKKSKYLSIIFDSKKSNFSEFNYLSYNEFYSFFSEESTKKLKEILTLDLKEKTCVKLQLNDTKDYQLTYFENFISVFDAQYKRLKNTDCQLRLRPIGESKIVGSIFWTIKNTKNHVSLIETKTIKKNYIKGPYLAICALIKPDHFINKVSNQIISEFIEKLGFKPYDLDYYNTEGIAYFIFKKPTQKRIDLILETLKHINKNAIFDNLVDAVGMVEIKQIMNEADLSENIRKFQFVLFSIKNKKRYDKYIFLPLSSNLNSLFMSFVKRFDAFIETNRKENFVIQTSSVKNYVSGNPTSMRHKKVVGKNIPIDEWKFFVKIPFIIFKYEMIWINFIIKNQLENKNTIIKITQENFIKNLNFSTKEMPTFLIYSFNNNFNIDILKIKIIELKKLKVATGFYIKKINKPLMNLINITQIRILVMAEEISNKINNLSILYDCIYILHIAKNNKIFLLYELTNRNLDTYIVKKAGVTAYFEPFI